MIKFIYLISLTLIATAFMAGCSLKQASYSLINYPDKGSQYPEAVKWYTDILSDEKASGSQKAKANVKLALLMSHHRNPEKDYNSALKHLEDAIAIDADIAKMDSLANLKSLLEEISDRPELNTQRLNRLKKENYELMEENAELMRVIEELNELEVELEKRRKEIR